LSKLFKNLFDGKDEITNRIVNFIDDASNKGEGLLISSLKGKNRSSVVVLIYLMKKYKWSLDKSIEYLKSKKNDMDIMKQFMTQLSLFEARLNRICVKSSDWNSN
jgi:protein-tyrosine phosphatase